MDATLVKDLTVNITLADGRQLTAKVDDVGPGHTDLRLHSAIDPASLPDRCKATIGWPTKVGGAMLDGELFPLESGSVVRLQIAGAIESIQRRDYVRVNADMPVAVITSGKNVVSRTIDISVGGIMLVEADELQSAEPVRIAIDLGDLTVTGIGKIVRIGDDSRAAIHFTDLPAESERQLSQFVARRQRELANQIV